MLRIVIRGLYKLAFTTYLHVLNIIILGPLEGFVINLSTSHKAKRKRKDLRKYEFHKTNNDKKYLFVTLCVL